MVDERTEFDISSLVAELDEEFAGQEVTLDDVEPSLEEQGTEEIVDEQATDTEIEEVADEVVVQEGGETPSEEEPNETGSTSDIMDEDIHKRNAAFKRLREERDRMEASDKFLQDLAGQYGLTKEQLMERFTQQQQEKMAKKEGISPEQYRKMQELESRIAQVEQEKQREIFNIKASAFMRTYSLDEKGMTAIFQEATRIGLDVGANPDLLEVVYRSMNYEKAIEQGRQKQIETTRQRKATSVGATGTTGSSVEPTIADWDAEIDSLLKEKGVIYE